MLIAAKGSCYVLDTEEIISSKKGQEKEIAKLERIIANFKVPEKKMEEQMKHIPSDLIFPKGKNNRVIRIFHLFF